MENMFNYKYAIVCRNIPNSITQGLSLHEHDPVNVDSACEDQKVYVEALKNLGLKLIEVDGDEKYPDCVFVEDAAIAIGKKILITNPGAESRRGEVEAMKTVVEAFVKENPDEKFEVGEIKNKQEAFVDGGDCCFTGRELLVGLSGRTNQKGIDEIAAFFNDIPVIAVTVSDTLHLKSVMSIGGYDTILINKLPPANSIRDQIKSKSSFGDNYKFIEVDEEKAANVLFLNNTLCHPSNLGYVYENRNEFENVKRIPLPNREFGKIDGCLTCRSVLF